MSSTERIEGIGAELPTEFSQAPNLTQLAMAESVENELKLEILDLAKRFSETVASKPDVMAPFEKSGFGLGDAADLASYNTGSSFYADGARNYEITESPTISAGDSRDETFSETVYGALDQMAKLMQAKQEANYMMAESMSVWSATKEINRTVSRMLQGQ